MASKIANSALFDKSACSEQQFLGVSRMLIILHKTIWIALKAQNGCVLYKEHLPDNPFIPLAHEISDKKYQCVNKFDHHLFRCCSPGLKTYPRVFVYPVNSVGKSKESAKFTKNVSVVNIIEKWKTRRSINIICSWSSTFQRLIKERMRRSA
jgi:hypothetical protein